MRPTTSLLLSASLLTLVILSVPASGDDELMPPPAPAPVEPAPPLPSYTYPAPLGSSRDHGPVPNAILPGGEVPPPVMQGRVINGPPAGMNDAGWPPPGTTPLGSGPLDAQPVRRSDRESIDQFQSSAYWTAPQPFDPFAAPNFSDGLAGAGGIHIRFPYFNYRAPWTYQGPAGISHTIVW